MSDNLKAEEIDLTLYSDDDVNNLNLVAGEVVDETAPVDANDDQNSAHHFIIRYNESDVNIKVNTKTAYLLQNDHSYAEKFVSSLMKQKIIKKVSKKLKSNNQESSLEERVDRMEKPAKEINSKDDEDKKKQKDSTSDSDCAWTYEGMGTLINVRLRMEDQFCNPMNSTLTLWMKVAAKINKSLSIKVSWKQCQGKFKYLMNAYRRCHRIHFNSNKLPTWPFYNQFHEAYGSKMDSQLETSLDFIPSDGEPLKKKKSWSVTDIWSLINMRLSINDEFTNIEEGIDDTELWEKVCKEVNENNTGGLKSPRTCKLKWLYLLDLYRKKRDPAISEEERNSWSYFAVLDKAFNGSIPNQEEVNDRAKSASWESSITASLLTTRIALNSQFGNPMNKRTILWDKVASAVNEANNVNLTGSQCHDRYRNAFRTYKQNVKKVELFGRRPTWKYFHIMHAAYQGKTHSMNPVQERLAKTTVSNLWFERNNKLLIKFRLQLNSEFVNRTLWLQIAQKMNTATKSHLFTWMACHFQWRKLRLEYDSCVERKKIIGQCDYSPYFDLFHKVYNGQPYNATDESVCNKVNYNVATIIEEPMNVDDGPDHEHNYANEESMSVSRNLKSARSPLPSTSPSKRQSGKAPEPCETPERRPSRIKTSTRRTDEYYEIDASNAIEEAIAGSQSKSNKTNSGHKLKGWFKSMLADWKEERQQRWQEKKQLEREKIKSINNLTKAILALDPDVDLNLGSENVKRRKLDP